MNGFVADSAEPADLADAVVRVVRGGAALRGSTLEWFARNREALSIESSLAAVEASYSAGLRPAQARS